jgi:hypothetical protein
VAKLFEGVRFRLTQIESIGLIQEHCIGCRSIYTHSSGLRLKPLARFSSQG